jgi:hypothetical protein
MLASAKCQQRESKSCELQVQEEAPATRATQVSEIAALPLSKKSKNLHTTLANM